MESILRKHIEDIVRITDDEFKVILSYFKRKSCKKRQVLVEMGELAQYEYFVLSGLLKSSHVDQMGKKHILQFAMENWWISDLEAFQKGTHATLDITCLEDSEVLCITHMNKEKLCAEIAKMDYFFRLKSSAGNIALQKRVLMLMYATATERYSALIHQYPLLYQRVSKTLIASYLGVTRETLSRLAAS
ncbi:MAG: Crp/Fnr family transcriptional regulator [Pedobacter agri]